MTSTDFKEKALDLVSKGQILKALSAINDYLGDNYDNELRNQSTLVEVRYRHIIKQRELNVISTEDFLIEQNRYNSAVISLIDTISKEEHEADGNGNNGNEKVNIFISYAHKDDEFRFKLEESLQTLKKDGKIDIWSEAQVNEEMDYMPSKQLEDADIILLLVSADFLTSFMWNELENIIKRHETGSVAAISIILRPCDWKVTPISKLQVLPQNRKPIIESENIDNSYFQISSRIKKIIERSEEYQREIKVKIIEHEEQIKNGLSDKNINNLEALIELYKKINNHKKVKKYQQDLAQLKFEYNISNPIKIKEFHIEDVSIYRKIRWELQPNINVLLGRNGFGKSHLMRLIPCMLRNEKSIMDKDYKLMNFSDLRVTVDQNGESKNTHYKNCEFMEDIGNIPMLAIPAVRNLNTNGSLTPTRDYIDEELKHIGAAHLIRQYPFDRLIQNHLYIFADNLITESLKNQKSIEQTVNNSFSVKLITGIIRQLTRDESFTIQTIKKHYGQAKIDFKVTTEGNPKPISLQKVSQGTISVLSIFLLIYHYLKSLYPELEDKKLVRQKALVFIDEIDAHMHPTWQRKIVNILRDSFPNIQFVLTAHSPLIVAGCLEKEVVVLRKEGDSSKFSLYQFSQNFIGKEIEDIYKEVFEVENVDEDETYKNFLVKRSRWSLEDIDKQINELEDKENLSEEEEVKLSELFLMSRIEGIREEKESNDIEEIVEKLRAENRQLKHRLATLEN